MQKKKAIIALLIILAMVLAIIPFKVFAAPTETEKASLVEIKLRKATGVTINNGKATITYENGKAEVTANGLQYDKKENQQIGMMNNEPVYGDMYYLYTTDTDVIFNLVPDSECVAQYWVSGQPNAVENNTYQMSGLQVGQGKDQEVEFTFMNAGGGNGGGECNTNATITVSGVEGSYTDRRYNPNTDTEEEVQVPYTNSYVNARFSINDSQVGIIEEDENNPPASADVPVAFNSEATDQNVTLYFRSLFLWEYKDKVTVNGLDYDIPFDYTNREAWLDHYDHQEIVFGITVPKGTPNVNTGIYEYDVKVKLQPAEHVFIGNFLWTANPEEEFRLDPQGNREENDDYVGHSKIEFVRVKYTRNGQTITKEKDELLGFGGIDEHGNNYAQLSSGDQAVDVGLTDIIASDGKTYQEGSMTVAEGAEVTLKIVPDYGYQATSFGINGDDLITGDNISEFTFVIREGNAHVGAKVTAVDNDVKSTSEAVTGGEIVLPDGEIETGTARLSVSDANVSEAKKEAFENQVGSEYEISSILGVDLNQVFYKGNNGTDVWTGDALEELNGEATIGLTLKDGIDPENSVIVHNVHDGDEFEKIAITEYDENTKTAYFKGKTFSNYAIATKTSATDTKKDDDSTSSSTEKANAVKTGDKIMIFVGTFALATIALVVTKKSKRSRRVSKH